MKKLLIVVPLRRASVRVPEKIYADINGTSLAQRTVEKVLQYAQGKTDVMACAAVDDARTVTHLKEKFKDLTVILTNPQLASGTDRVNAAYESLVATGQIDPREVSAVVNLQGDMPFFSIAILESARQHFARHPAFAGVWTAGHAFASVAEIAAPQCVKALRSDSGRAVYFSRFAIPFSRTEPVLGPACLCHIGIYAYSPLALKTFCAAKPSVWEQAESLEQLRALHLDLDFVIDEVAAPTDQDSYKGIDTPEDLEWSRAFAKTLAAN